MISDKAHVTYFEIETMKTSAGVEAISRWIDLGRVTIFLPCFVFTGNFFGYPDKPILVAFSTITPGNSMIEGRVSFSCKRYKIYFVSPFLLWVKQKLPC